MSFLAFELMHFAIDRRRGRIGETSLVDLAAYALFFPCRVAGPIRRFPDFMAAVARAEASLDDVYAGVGRILIGLVKKVVVADVLALTVAEAGLLVTAMAGARTLTAEEALLVPSNEAGSAATALHVWKIVLAYSLQIFFDFSAYSDIAIGVSRVLGVRVPENFRWPYLSPNIREFWNRWHVTLSAWVRDYVFLPAGHAAFRTRLRRAPLFVAAASYLGSFLIIGAWHGLAANYLLWGAYHGALLTGYQAVRARLSPAIVTSRLYRSPLATAAGTAITFTLVSIGWVLFMTNPSDAWRLLRIMFGAG